MIIVKEKILEGWTEITVNFAITKGTKKIHIRTFVHLKN